MSSTPADYYGQPMSRRRLTNMIAMGHTPERPKSIGPARWRQMVKIVRRDLGMTV